MKIFQRWGKIYPFLFQKGGKTKPILFQKGGKRDCKSSLRTYSEIVFFLLPTFIKASPMTIQTISRTRVINAA